MQWINKLYLKHNEPVWIAGSSPSLDSYPDNFMDDKFSVVLHNAYLKFPNTDYRYANESPRIDEFKKNNPEYLDKKCIFAYPFYLRNQPLMEELIDLDNPNYYFLVLRPIPKKITDIVFLEKKIVQAKEGSAIDFGGYATCLHACMFATIMMGCREINIIGCDHAMDGDKQHFSKADKFSRGWNYKTLGAIQEKGTTALMKACENQGIKVRRFKNYEDCRLQLRDQSG